MPKKKKKMFKSYISNKILTYEYKSYWVKINNAINMFKTKLR